ncbi:hypothetical protein [Ralstonia pseudosolanacearum]|uniref:hypothetical protein n=1 Tax=Ralstonia pseudosolanacearum TaxID=1310165 RepID=UPI0033916C46
MAENYWGWFIFSCLVVLALTNRILRGNAGKEFPRLRVIVGKISSFIGWLWLVVFLLSMVFMIHIGFPEH